MKTEEQVRSGRERLGILGGTFDPVHKAHLEMAGQAIREASLDWVAFVPARQSPHKMNAGNASPGDRAEMVRRSIEGRPQFRLVAWELHRPGPSYSVETAAHFRERYPSAELFWIMGSDQWEVLHLWKDWQRLAEWVTFVVFFRPGPVTPRAGVRHVAVEFAFDISSTMVRECMKRDGSWRDLVPEPVGDYITARKLYRYET